MASADSLSLPRRRWSATKCERIQDKLEATVAGESNDVEHLLDVLIAAWEEMHREAKRPNWFNLNRLAGFTLDDTEGDGCGRYTAVDKLKILARIGERADRLEGGYPDA